MISMVHVALAKDAFDLCYVEYDDTRELCSLAVALSDDAE